MPRSVLPPPMNQPLLPDIPNWAWHEYGMRAGFWRLLDVLSQRSIRATFAVNGSACTVYAPACKAALEAGWEFMGHGYVQRPMHTVEDQIGAIRQTIAAIEDFTGKRPRGWESPGLTETDETVDLLAECGVEYVADWVLDDQPVAIRTHTGSIVSVPYTVEVNDVVISAIQQQRSDEIFLRGRDQFDRLYEEGQDGTPRVMAISLHPYLTGVPHRIKYLEALYDHIGNHRDVVMWTGEEILDWYRSQVEVAASVQRR
jgi:peptidoglycan/xylan/chitin deacetylase (PgdA/CDA1 family)